MPASRLVATAVAVAVLVAMSVVAWAGASDPEEPRPVAAQPTAVTGSSLFRTKGCAGCHESGIGPPLTALPGVAAGRVTGMSAEAYVRQSIRDPGAYTVPGYQVAMPSIPLSDAELESLVSFLLAQSR